MSALKFFPGIVILQAATVFAVLAMPGSLQEGAWMPLVVLLVSIGSMSAFWFRSIAENIKKDAIAKSADGYAQERERLKVAAEVEKRTALEETHRRIERESKRVHARANVKLGLGVLALLIFGGTLLAIEFMTFGLLIVATAGGTLAGYVIRARQERLGVRAFGVSAALPARSEGNSIRRAGRLTSTGSLMREE